MANQATGAIVAKKFAHAYEESERLTAELSMFDRENAMLRDEIDRLLLLLRLRSCLSLCGVGKAIFVISAPSRNS
jgi:hypothetical protein